MQTFSNQLSELSPLKLNWFENIRTYTSLRKTGIVGLLEILAVELWDEAGSGGEETGMRKRGLTRNEW